MTEFRAGVGGVVDRYQAGNDRVVARAAAPPPELESFADSIYDAVLPLAWLDESVGYALAIYCGALGAMFQPVDSVARDTDDGPGWSAVVDLNRCPDAWLPWLGQLVGVTVPPGQDAATQRAWIARTDGFRRGTVDALRAASQLHLTDSRTVFFTERLGGDAYVLGVRTLTTETPDPYQTLADIIAQKPGGIVLDYGVVAGPTYDVIRVAVLDYAELRTEYADYGAMRSTMPTP
jgi:hypothetical protein